MREKTERLRKLLAEGYQIVAIETEGGVLETTLRRGHDVLRLRFGRADALDLLALERAA